MTHGTEVVNLGGPDLSDNGDEAGRVAQVAVVEEKFDSSVVTISVDVVDTTSVETRRTADNSMNLQGRPKVKGGVNGGARG